MELSFLHPLLRRPGPWASVVVDTSRHSEDAAKQTELRNRAAARELLRLGADQRTVRAVADRLAAEPTSGSPAGRALFATEGRVLLEAELASAPVPVETTWSALPRLTPLLSLRSECPDILLVLIDRTGADLELCDEHGRHALAGAQGPQGREHGHRTVPGDRYEWHYQHRVEDSWQRTAQVVADEVARRHACTPECVVALAGDPRERHEVLRRLPRRWVLRVVELRTGGRAPGGADHALDEELELVRAQVAAEHTDQALTDLVAGRTRDPATGRARRAESVGRTTEGVPEVLRAARERRLATLLLDPAAPDTARTVWTGTDPLHLSAERGEVRALGEPYPRPARADDALLRAAIALDAEALAVPPSGLGPVGGVGALLRWPQPTAVA